MCNAQGHPTSESRWTQGPSYPTTGYTHYSAGLVHTVTDPKQNTTTYRLEQILPDKRCGVLRTSTTWNRRDRESAPGNRQPQAEFGRFDILEALVIAFARGEITGHDMQNVECCSLIDSAKVSFGWIGSGDLLPAFATGPCCEGPEGSGPSARNHRE